MAIPLRSKLALARFSQVAIVFSMGLAMYLLTTIPHNWWIFMTVLLMMAANEPGLVIKKSIGRGKGTLSGVVLLVPAIYLLQFNYRLVPLVFILTAIGVTVPTVKRYDISVMFATVNVSLVMAYNFTTPMAEGPVELAFNRTLCTMVGIIICIAGDYFLFRRFNYEHKVYYLAQHELYELLEDNFKKIIDSRDKSRNRLLTVEYLRDSLNNKFSFVATCGESLLYSLTTTATTRSKIEQFGLLVWQLRKSIYAIYYTECILCDQKASQLHIQRFNQLMIKARDNFVALND